MRAQIRYVCVKCGGDNVGHDATVKWDVEKQAWDISGIFDNSFCDDCGDDIDIKEEAMPTEKLCSADCGTEALTGAAGLREQLKLVRNNLVQGMGKRLQKLQARAIDEVLKELA